MTDVLPRRPQRTTDRPVARWDEGAVVQPSRSQDPVALNPTAWALWEICDGRTDVDEMVLAICTLFAVEEQQARADVESALRDMLSLGVIR